MDDLKPILKMYFEGYSQRQISDRLKRSRNTVAEIDELPQGKPQTSIRKNKIQIKGIVLDIIISLFTISIIW